jgi:hypothetical protein
VQKSACTSYPRQIQKKAIHGFPRHTLSDLEEIKNPLFSFLGCGGIIPPVAEEMLEGPAENFHRTSVRGYHAG